MQVIAHGGAGSPPDEPADRQAVLDTAVDQGTEVDTPLAAVCETVCVLEADPQFNAGRGGAVQSDGRVRTDAGVMTADGATGAAAAMEGVVHAVDVARAVATETPHVMLAGERAVDFADAVDVETGADLLTERTRKKWRETDQSADDVASQLAWVRERFGATNPTDADAANIDPVDADHTDHDTVGAVATNGTTVATATSTGGRWFALAGRVGDVPQVGAGFYASPAGGASATGAGEDIARDGLARRAVAYLEDGLDADVAAEQAIEEFDESSAGDAGLVVLAPDGDAGEAHSSPAMQTSRHE